MAVARQFILTGNVRDRYLVDAAGSGTYGDITRALWSVLEPAGYKALLRFDIVDGFQVCCPETPDEVTQSALTDVRCRSNASASC
jgi:hypothetical protein